MKPKQTLYTLTIAIDGPEDRHVIASLSLTEPDAKRLATRLGEISPGVGQQVVRNALKMGFAEINDVIINDPDALDLNDPDREPTEDEKLYGGRLIPPHEAGTPRIGDTVTSAGIIRPDPERTDIARETFLGRADPFEGPGASRVTGNDPDKIEGADTSPPGGASGSQLPTSSGEGATGATGGSAGDTGSTGSTGADGSISGEKHRDDLDSGKKTP